MTATLTAAVMLLTGCGSSNADSNSDDTKNGRIFRLISSYDLLEPEHNGMFTLTEYGRLDFVDFDTLASMPVCDDPTCKHTPPAGSEDTLSEKDCQAYGKNGHPFIYNEKIYCLRLSDYGTDEGKYYQSSELWQCSINGADNRRICIFDKLTLPDYSKALLYDGSLYMLMIKQPYDTKMKDLEPSVELVRTDLKDGEVKYYGTVKSSYSIGGMMKGVSGGKVIFEVNYPETNIHFMDKVTKYAEENGVSEQDAMQHITANEKYSFDRYELEGDTFRKCEKQDLIGITESGCYYSENGKVRFIGSDNKEQVYEIDAKDFGFYDVGDHVYLFNSENAWLIDEQKRECHTLKDKPEIVFIKDGQAVVREFTTPELPYKKIAVQELIA